MSGTLTQSQLQALRTLKASFSVLADEFEGIKDTMDADFALQLSLIIGDDESESEGDVVGVSLTQEQIENLRTLRDQYNDLLTLIGENTDTASAATIFGKLAAVIGALADMQGELPDVTLSSISDDIDETRNDILDKFDDLDDVIGSPATGQPATLFAAIAAGGGGGGGSADALEQEVETGKVLLAQAIIDKGGTATSAMSLSQLASAIDSIQYPTRMVLDKVDFRNTATNTLYDMGGIKDLYGTGLNINGVGAYVEEVRNFPNTPQLTSMRNFWRQLAMLKKIDFTGINTTAVTNFEGFLYNNPNLEWADCTAIDASSATTFTYPISANPKLTTIVGNRTYADVVSQDIKVFKGLNMSANLNQLTFPPLLGQNSIRAIINGLADRTGQTALTLTIGTDALNKLSAEDIAVATNKNWTLA